MNDKILKVLNALFKSKSSKDKVTDGVISPLDGFDVSIENISEIGFDIKVNTKTINVNWSTIEFIAAYRTNKIKDSPIHIDLWPEEGGYYPLHSNMKGWNKFIEKLPICLPLQNFATLQLMPWTQNIMTAMLFTLLYDKKERTMEEIYNWKYAVDGVKILFFEEKES